MKILQNKCKNKKTEKLEKIKNKEKNLTIEILRIIACFLVIVCHTNPWSFDKNIIDTGWFLGVAVYLISKTAVPIFFMISGALYLRKDYSYKEMIKKIFRRILLPLILFSTFIYFKDNREISLLNVINFINMFLKGEILQYYWFLYTLIGLYLITPFIRKMIMNFKNKDYIIFFTIWIIFLGILPILQEYANMSITKDFQIPLVTGYIGYYILGYYMLNYMKIKKNKKYLFINIILFILTIVLSTVITYFDYVKTNCTKYLVFLDKLNYISIILPTINIIYIARYLLGDLNFSEKATKIVMMVSSTTFGIYLIHGVLLGKFTEYIFSPISKYMWKFIASIISQIVVFIIMIITVYILKKLPIIRKII